MANNYIMSFRFFSTENQLSIEHRKFLPKVVSLYKKQTKTQIHTTIEFLRDYLQYHSFTVNLRELFV